MADTETVTVFTDSFIDSLAPALVTETLPIPQDVLAEMAVRPAPTLTQIENLVRPTALRILHVPSPLDDYDGLKASEAQIFHPYGNRYLERLTYVNAQSLPIMRATFDVERGRKALDVTTWHYLLNGRYMMRLDFETHANASYLARLERQITSMRGVSRETRFFRDPPSPHDYPYEYLVTDSQGTELVRHQKDDPFAPPPPDIRGILRKAMRDRLAV